MKLKARIITFFVFCSQRISFSQFIYFNIYAFFVFLCTGCSSITNSADENDTNFSWEIQQASMSWGKEPLKLETMFGFRLRMSESEYESNFDSLITIGLANNRRQIKFGNTYDEYFELTPVFFNDTLFQLDFKLFPLLTSLDTMTRSVDMLDVIVKLYTDKNVMKTDTTYKSESNNILFYTDAYGWIENNRLIKVYRTVLPNSIIRSYEFRNAEYIDLQLKSRYEVFSNKKVESDLDSVRNDKLMNISK